MGGFGDARAEGRPSDDAQPASARAAPAILLVEDDDAFARLVTDTLCGRPEAPAVHTVRGAGEAAALLAQRSFDLIVVDRGLPDGDGFLVVRSFTERGLDTPFVLLTADASATSAVAALKAGAVDYLVKGPGTLDRLADVVGAALEMRPRPTAGHASGAASLRGASPAMAAVRALVERYARSRACVLVEGETGVGKELVARALHYESPRAGGPFVAINCGALPEHLVESELFGHVRGAFTGAHRDHAGLVEHAERGTLFLDEVEDLPPGLQGKLLRMLQESEYRPVGASRVRRADVRVVAASNAALHGLVEERRFRRDLFYRLNVLRIVVPPLRERREDLPALLAHLVTSRTTGSDARQECAAAGRFVTPSAAQLQVLQGYAWPGNVRELANLVERARVFAAASGWAAGWGAALAELEAQCLVLPPPPLAAPGDTATPAKHSERAVLLRLLERHRWRREAAARELGISRVTLWRRMRRVGLGPDGDAPAADP